MQSVLVTNDDGYKSAGIRALILALQNNFQVTAVAPEFEQSWVSKSISRHREVHVNEVEYLEFKGFTVDGTPCD